RDDALSWLARSAGRASPTRSLDISDLVLRLRDGSRHLRDAVPSLSADHSINYNRTSRGRGRAGGTDQPMKFVARHLRVLRIACFAIALAAPFAAPRVSIACPTCKDGMAANDPEHEHMVKGYFYSILFMMGMPY